jgi:pimeloyl-ACP methyl ester carboxylesterase
MQLSVKGSDTFIATGGRPFDPNLPAVVMLHGAGLDHSTWALHSRWFAHHGYSVLAPDLPDHGRSSGKALTTIADMADWTAALLEAAGAPKAKLVGHSMGSLIALETSVRHPDKVSGLSLIGTAATMTVGPDLLKAAEANDPDAIDMVSIWGLGFKAELGGSLAPGLWMHQGAQRVLQQTRLGLLYSDLNACNSARTRSRLRRRQGAHDSFWRAHAMTSPRLARRRRRQRQTPAPSCCRACKP